MSEGRADGWGMLSPPPVQPDWGNMQKWRSMHHRGVKRKFYLIHVACTTAGKKGIFYSRLRHDLLFRGLSRLVKIVA